MLAAVSFELGLCLFHPSPHNMCCDTWCCRNLVGGLGPVAVAKLAELVGLQHAMLLAPVCYLASGILFFGAERIIESEQQEQKKHL